jgi:hypothetical protein
MLDTERPEGITDEHLTFLDELRESGVTNMLGSPTYLRERFELTKQESFRIVDYWMKTFGRDKR